jgi:hypothetical protein
LAETGPDIASYFSKAAVAIETSCVIGLCCMMICLLTSIYKVLFQRDLWHAQYFEAEADLPYLTEKFSCRSSLDAAVKIFTRLGGDDVLKITGPGFDS